MCLFPCPYCAVKLGQLAAEAGGRCTDCCKIDELITEAEQNLNTGGCELTQCQRELLEFLAHRNMACHHHDFLDSEAKSVIEDLSTSEKWAKIIEIILPQNSSSFNLSKWKEYGEYMTGKKEEEIYAELHPNDGSGRCGGGGGGRGRGRGGRGRGGVGGGVGSSNFNKLNAKEWFDQILNWRQRFEITFDSLDRSTDAQINEVGGGD